MSKPISFKKEFAGELDDVIARVTAALKSEGFGVLTRIDMHEKIKEKTGKQIPPTVILGACNPNFAYEAYQMSTDVTALLPCNTVIREVGPARMSVEIARPSSLIDILGDQKLSDVSAEADTRLERVLGAV